MEKAVDDENNDNDNDNDEIGGFKCTQGKMQNKGINSIQIGLVDSKAGCKVKGGEEYVELY